MNLVDFKIDGGILVLMPNGKIDTSNANDVQANIDEIKSSNNYTGMVIDCENLEYLSSVGLRIVLKLLKENSGLKIVNASPEVYEIFDMTGFTDMMTVEKAYRKVSIDGCEIIGSGANGDVYRINADTIVKVYKNPDSVADIKNERELARKAFVKGIPTAISYDIVKVGDKFGSVFELLDCPSISKILSQEPEQFDTCMSIYADILKKLHQTPVEPGEVPNIKEFYIDMIKFLKDELDKADYEKLLGLVEAVPESNTLIHGDYHTKNIHIMNGEALLIDMDTLSYGNPVFEFPAIFNAYLGFYAYKKNEGDTFMGYSFDMNVRVWKRTLEEYFGTNDKKVLQDVEDKASLLGYVKLLRRLIRHNAKDSEEGRCEMEFYKNKISSLLDKVDSLVF